LRKMFYSSNPPAVDEKFLISNIIQHCYKSSEFIPSAVFITN